MFAKIKKVRTTPWNMLTTGEKWMKAIMKIVKWGLILAIIAAAIYAFIFLGFLVIFVILLGGGWLLIDD